MSLEAWGDDDCDRPYTQERVDEIVHEAIEEYRTALEICTNLVKAWHGPEAWDIYYNHSPEMKPIRDLLGKI